MHFNTSFSLVCFLQAALSLGLQLSSAKRLRITLHLYVRRMDTWTDEETILTAQRGRECMGAMIPYEFGCPVQTQMLPASDPFRFHLLLKQIPQDSTWNTGSLLLG